MRRRVWPLGIAVLIHGLAGLLLVRSPQRTVAGPGPVRVSQLVFVTPPKAVTLPPPRHAPVAVVARQPRHAEALPATVPVPAAAPATEPMPMMPPEAQQAYPLPAAADIMAQARRDLRKIDREILGRAQAVPDQRPDSLQARLARGIDNAFVGNTAQVSDHYTAADGVVYSRVTRGGRSTCFMNGAPTLAAATRGGGNWTQVNCPPPDSGWVR